MAVVTVTYVYVGCQSGLWSNTFAFASANASFLLALAFHCPVVDAFALAFVFDSFAFAIAFAFDSNAFDSNAFDSNAFDWNQM